jgi:2-keto-3-deoxy-L-rhamnonate aldolase RhmA
MDKPFHDLLARHAADGSFAVGTFVMSASPIIAEAIGCAGFDWAVVDMEHAPLDLSTLVHTLQALAGTGMVPVTRVPWNDSVMVKRVLDAGAQTLLFPFRSRRQRRWTGWRKLPAPTASIRSSLAPAT